MFESTHQFFDQLKDQVLPQAIENQNTNIQFDINGEAGGQFTVSIVDGALDIVSGLAGTPITTIKANDEVFLSIINKDQNPMMAMLTGKLKVSNPVEILKFAKILGIM